MTKVTFTVAALAGEIITNALETTSQATNSEITFGFKLNSSPIRSR
jgi:sensor histidine kinase regulating citrate/malate metabolism